MPTQLVSPIPPPFTRQDPYQVFILHYVYHQAARGGERPSIGRIVMTSGLGKRTCIRYRLKYERELQSL